MLYALFLSLILSGCIQKWQDMPRKPFSRYENFRKPVQLNKKDGYQYTIKNSQGHFNITSQKHYHLDECGIASYYGDKFHNRKTAIGVIYNQWDMTSAHPTIPLPAVLKVSRVDSGKHIYVLAIDRGPFVKKGENRVIDLSRGAAKVLGMEKQGVAHVRVQCLVRASEKLRKEWHTHKKDGKIPYNLVSKYVRKNILW
ncbi:septal ring lytic transglycosylase RlpA family protein [Candidatus Cytomitobacter primus]|uniref:Endolytic peptidoglycan transglycosylase RlpA n=1 Tax=Candidatus Cytomitobacter primus TaxID=2066024 RepID=A0A5C0UEB2_9PROT|nr:septal ring lytic transglycosylase RlpA family protein [Candidatus Cytomitobacter primus]QEK38378.1 septal ring lytic transglycosylase RlpA family protein [Candidatus Cytomitobacter primus]